jgi:O-antigen/teichoic acid export membrane protein
VTRTEPVVTRPTSLASSAARGTLITLVGQAVRIGTQFVSIYVLARLLNSVDYGFLAMVMGLVGIAELLRDFGLSAAAVQAKHLSHAQQSNLFWLNTAIGAASAVIVLSISPLVALLYGEPPLTAITMALAPVFLLNGMATQFRARINRNLRFVALSVADVVPQVVAFAAAVSVALALHNYWALVIQQLTIAVIGLVMTVVLARWRPSRPRRATSLRSEVRFGSNLLTTNLMAYGVNNVQTVLIGAIWGAGVVGFFSRAYQLMALPLTQIVAPLTKVALPVLSRVYDDRPRYARIVGRAQLVGLYLTAPLFLLCCTLSGPLIRLALGSKWTAVIPIFGVLALGGAFRAMSQLSHWIFLSSGATGVQMKFNALAYPILVALMATGLPWQGLGVAIGHTLGYALYWPIALAVACRSAGIPFRPLAVTAGRIFGLVGGGVFVISAATTLIGMSDLLTVLVAASASLGYVALTMAVIPAGRADFRMLSGFAKRLRR